MTEYWKIDKDLVEHITLISRIKLTEEETELYTSQLNEIINSFKMLDELAERIKDENAAFHAVTFKNIWREDTPKKIEWNPLSNSKESEDGYIKGPKIM